MGRLYFRLFRSAYALALLTIAVFAMAIRVLHVIQCPFLPTSDMQAYIDHARLLFSSSKDEIYTTLFPPGYIWFVALMIRLSSAHFQWLIQMAQVLLDGGTLLIIAEICRRLCNKKCALVAASCYALFQTAALNTALLMSECLAVFLFALSLLLFICYRENRGIAILLACAFVSTLMVHTRVNLLVVPVCYGTYLLMELVAVRRDMLRIGVMHIALFGGLIALSLIPWSVRNSRLVGYPAFISINGDLNILQGNHPYTEGGWYGGSLPDEQYAEMRKLPWAPSIKEGGRLGREFMREYWAYEAFYLVPQRAHALFLAPQVFWPWDQSIESNYRSHPFGARIRIPLLPFGLFFVPGLLGFMLNGKKGSAVLLPMLWLGVTIPLLIVPAASRYHYVSDFLLLISSSMLIEKLIPSERFKMAFIAGWSGVALMMLGGTLINTLRFSGSNMLEAKPQLALANTAVSRVALVDTTSATASLNRFPLAELPVDAREASHLLLQAELKVVEGRPNQHADILVTFFNENNTTVTAPKHADTLLPARVGVNPPPADFQTFWRVLLVPASARKLTLTYKQDFVGKTAIRGLTLQGPCWGRGD